MTNFTDQVNDLWDMYKEKHDQALEKEQIELEVLILVMRGFLKVFDDRIQWDKKMEELSKKVNDSRKNKECENDS